MKDYDAMISELAGDYRIYVDEDNDPEVIARTKEYNKAIDEAIEAIENIERLRKKYEVLTKTAFKPRHI